MVDLNDKNGVEITNKSFSLKKLKESNTTLQYGSFLKSATLLANVGKEEEIEGHTSTNDIEIKPISVLTDEELFKACNGRTAHKGARHGLNLTGKLQRIAAQEKDLLERMKGKQNKHEVFQEPATKKHKKNPLAELNSSKDESSDELPVDNESDYILKASGKRRKRDRKQEAQLVTKIISIGLDEPMPAGEESPVERGEDEEPYNGTPVRKKKKSKRASEKLLSIQEYNQEVEEESSKKSKKKKKKGKRKLDEDDDEMPKVKESKPETQSKKVKLNSSYEASGDEEDVVDKINAEQEALRMGRKMKKSTRKTEKNRAKKTANYLAQSL